ncbi:MAG: M48 family metallopeptidase [Alphaproteobacteria bacterium]
MKKQPSRGGRIHDLDLGTRTVPLRVRRNSRARRLILRIDAENDGAVVTVPPHAKIADGLEMARSQADWIAEKLSDLSPRVAFTEGAVIPLSDIPHRIRHDPDAKGGVRQMNAELVVSGRHEHTARRVGDWLKAEARRVIAPMARQKAALIGRKPSTITVRDTRSRWGSCSARGGLSFSWRLVLAPGWVLDYVVAHEVAHLAHLNHGKDFWRTVGELTSYVEDAQDWLGAHGSMLHRYG